MSVTALSDFRRVAIVDDSQTEAEEAADMVQDGGFEPIILPPRRDLPSMLQQIEASADVLLCDHRLHVYADVEYNGASLLARWLRPGRPGLLMTQFNRTDCDTTIRAVRHKLPVVLPRQDLDDERFQRGLGDCVAELDGQVPPWRRPRRTLVHVQDLSNEGGVRVLDAILPGWKSHESVRFPLELIAPELRSLAVKDSFFFAQVNVGAESSSELFLISFEPAPPPTDEDADG